MAIKLQLQNKLINGAFDFWQRGTSFAAVANVNYTADRWAYGKVGTAVHTISRSTDIPTESLNKYSLLMTLTTAQAVLGATDLFGIQQRIEGNILKNFKNKKIVLSFWVKASKIGTYSISFFNSATNRSLVKAYTINTINTWEKKTIRIIHDSTGTWNYDNSFGMNVFFTIASGTTMTSTPDVWNNSFIVGATGQVNLCDTLGATFQLSDVCLVEDNEGQTRQPDFMYAGRGYFEEFELCQRYYEKSYDLEVAPGTASAPGGFITIAVSTSVGATSTLAIFKVGKRATPVVTVFNPITGAIGSFRRSDSVDVAAASGSINTVSSQIYNTAVNVANTSNTIHWIAESEL